MVKFIYCLAQLPFGLHTRSTNWYTLSNPVCSSCLIHGSCNMGDEGVLVFGDDFINWNFFFTNINVRLEKILLSIEETFLTQWFFIISTPLFTRVNSHNLADKAIKRYKTKFPSFYCCSQDLCFMCIFSTDSVKKKIFPILHIGSKLVFSQIHIHLNFYNILRYMLT